MGVIGLGVIGLGVIGLGVIGLGVIGLGVIGLEVIIGGIALRITVRTIPNSANSFTTYCFGVSVFR
ncbi:MAG: hypothetical protein RSE13_17385 [Planktothrix sp. GU0601_MAG3]|nr:MAG: hypothetical protein RSE13_17385 [Planktothrix sp. GU0601_MAG3]